MHMAWTWRDRRNKFAKRLASIALQPDSKAATVSVRARPAEAFCLKVALVVQT
jgi:hypothetical protein